MASEADPYFRDAWWVEGRVVLPPGTPADEHVEVIAKNDPFDLRPHHRSPIGTDGSFRVAFVRGTSMGFLQLDAKYLYLEKPFTISPEADRRVLLEPRLGGRIEGRVFLPVSDDSRKATVIGREVQLWSSWNLIRTGIVDERLTFLIAGVPAGRDYSMRADSTGFQARPRNVTVEPGRTETIVLELQVGAPVSGIVIDPSGAPVTRASVTARGLARSTEGGVSEANGRFAFTALSPGTWDLSASADGFADSHPFRVETTEEVPLVGIELRLRVDSWISGRVVGLDGEPATYAVLALRRQDRAVADVGPSTGSTKTTDRLGDFEFHGLAPGLYDLVAESKDGGKSGKTLVREIAVEESAPPQGLVVRLERPARIEGRVIGPDGNPVRGAGVSARLAVTDFRASEPATTGESGRFILEAVLPCEVVLSSDKVSLAVNSPTTYSVRPGQALRVELVMKPAIRVCVVVPRPKHEELFALVTLRDEKGRTIASDVARYTPKRRELECVLTAPAPGEYVVELLVGDSKEQQTVDLSDQEMETVHFSAK